MIKEVFQQKMLMLNKVMESQLSHIDLEQFPTLNFIVERAEKIRNYQPEEFFYLEIKVKKKDKNGENIVTFNWERNRIF